VNKLMRQIRREAARSPQKAVVLGLLAVVALWFWAPLVLGWVQGEGAKKPKAAVEGDKLAGMEYAAPLVPPAGGPNPRDRESATEDAATLGDWQEMIAWIESDPKSDPAGAAAPARDPFVSIEFPPVHDSLSEHEEEQKDEKEEVARREVKPAEIGLVLSSTLVGPGGGLALISGKKYRLGEKVVVTHQSRTIQFTLAEVHPRRAVLQRDEKSYSLTIPRPDGTEEANNIP